MEPSDNSLSTVEWCEAFARSAEEREKELGHPAPNCPTAADLWRVAEIVRQIGSGSDECRVSEAHAHMQELAEISDRWLDPESDQIGVTLHPAVEGIIEGLKHSLEVTLPDAAEDLREWSNLRLVKQAAQRTIYRRGLNPPLWSRIWTKITARRSEPVEAEELPTKKKES